uniref:Uncharacterized protein n=1 Tax=Arundo donax TaxID=35708 RepID=A0A0A8YXQ3_ARUDO
MSLLQISQLKQLMSQQHGLVRCCLSRW